MLPLVADGSALTVDAAIVGIIVAAAGLLIGWLGNGKQMMVKLNTLTTQVFDLQEKAAGFQKADLECEVREAELKAELASAQRRIEVLETVTGVTHSTPVPGIVIAGQDGIIREFSPSMTVFLGWTAEEMLGQSIEKMMPPDELAKHHAAFANVISHGLGIDPTKRVLTYALDKNGTRVPISIGLRRWDGAETFITATITPRATVNLTETKAAPC